MSDAPTPIRREFSAGDDLILVTVMSELGCSLGQFSFYWPHPYQTYQLVVSHQALHALHHCSDVLAALRDKPNKDWAIEEVTLMLSDRFGFLKKGESA